MRQWMTVACVLLTLAGLAAPFSDAAQTSKKVHRIGYVGPEPPPTPELPAIGLSSLQQGLRELGYLEGQNLVIESRWLYPSAYRPGQPMPPDRVSRVVADLVARDVEVIVTYVTIFVTAIQRETSTVPIVCAVCADLVGGGAVASLARPGRNVTGLSVMAPDLVAKRLEFLKALGASRVIALHGGQPGIEKVPVVANFRQSHDQGLRALGLQGEVLRANSIEEMEQGMATMGRGRDIALLFIESAMYLHERRQIAAWAARQGRPTAFAFREHVDAGGLLSYGANIPAMFRRAAAYVDKILKGAKPADLPVEQPTEFELVINLKTAKALGLTVPQTLIIQAAEVIQ